MFQPTFKAYFAPTPKRIRAAADAVLASCTFAATMTAFTDYPRAGLVLAAIAVLAKFVSNFFTDAPEEVQGNQQTDHE